MKKETISMDAKLRFFWMRWISQLHNRNHLETKMIPHFQRRRKRFMIKVNKFLLLHLLMPPRYWRKTFRPLAMK
ncbi:hypothetical protein Gogos_021248 [Gossypium gossypioides]|uniref:Uncharacterized protein n=1 Tax=Gossypium gossypioides TaxID=34282 RepID=A0A7J9D0P3_GOSGO|nr:hypothetical protein [Gossypium gossypioides]